MVRKLFENGGGTFTKTSPSPTVKALRKKKPEKTDKRVDRKTNKLRDQLTELE